MSDLPSTSGTGEPMKMPRPHRCNDRVEDLLQAVLTLEFSTKIKPAYKTLRKCLSSEVGSEPKDPHVVITNPEQYLEPIQMYHPRQRE